MTPNYFIHHVQLFIDGVFVHSQSHYERDRSIQKTLLRGWQYWYKHMGPGEREEERSDTLTTQHQPEEILNT